MDKDIYLKDYLVSRIISFGKEIPGYGRVYYRTNEDLDTIYRDLDFHKKKVLSVFLAISSYTSSGVLSDSSFNGSSAIPSPRITIYFIQYTSAVRVPQTFVYLLYNNT